MFSLPKPGAAPRRLARLALATVIAAAAVVPSAPRVASAKPLPDGNGAIIAIVIDDVVDGARLDAFLTLDAPITYALFPFQRRGASASAKVIAAGGEVIIHTPVSSRKTRPGSWYLGRNWTQAQVDEWVDRAIASVPGAVGANNHKGSTTSIRAMRHLMQRLYQRGLFFMDSVTVPQTVAYAAAQELGMPSRINNAFLDNKADAHYTEQRIYGLAIQAAKHGMAIGIGHLQRKSTLEALRKAIPVLLAHGYVIKPLSEVTSYPNSKNIRRILPGPHPTTTTSTTTTTTTVFG